MKKKLLLTASVFVLTLVSAFAAKAGQWENSSSGWRYQDDTGSYIKSSWFHDKDGSWYHFNSDGYMEKEWVIDNGKWYYLDYPNGYLRTNMWISGKYFVGGDGAMLTDTTTPDGYKVGADGTWVDDGRDIFKKLAGDYSFINSIHRYTSDIKLKEDGTYTGSFLLSNQDKTKFRGADVTGIFVNPKKINDYTYSLEMKEFHYDKAIGSREVGDDWSNTYEKVDFVEKGKYFYVYVEGTDVDSLPEDIKSYGDRYYNGIGGKVKSRIIYNPESKEFVVYDVFY